MNDTNQKPTTKDSFGRRVAGHLTARALWEAIKWLYEQVSSL